MSPPKGRHDVTTVGKTGKTRRHHRREDRFEGKIAPAELEVLVTIASRFPRTSWKYQSMALALQLKNLGVLYAHLCLVATAMELAPCALGAGDSDLFCRIAKTDYLAESSIGEFRLGSI